MAHTTTSLVVYALIALVAGVISSPLLLRVANKRSLGQPLEAHPDDERRIIATILHRPQLFALISQLDGAHMVNETRGRIWATIKAACGDFPASGDENELLELGTTIDPELADHVLANLNRSDRQTARELLDDLTLRLDTTALIAAASNVYSAGIDRIDYAGRSTITTTNDDTRPLTRSVAAPTLLRRLVTVTLTGLGTLAAILVSVEQDSTLSGILAGAALLTLTVGSVIWTLVDLDTMYVDLTSFLSISAAAGALTVVHAITTKSPWPAIWGLTTAGAVVLFIEIANRVYRKVRHQHGMGGGDYMLIVPTIGIPSALVGQWVLGQWILILSLLSGIVGWVGHRATVAGFTRHSPYAFGPYLASGWILATLLWTVGQ